MTRPVLPPNATMEQQEELTQALYEGIFRQNVDFIREHIQMTNIVYPTCTIE